MSKLMKTSVLLVAACMVVTLLGCGGKETVVPASGPQWVTSPDKAFPGDRGKVIYAVGIGPDALNPRLTRDRARDAGRVEMSRMLQVKIQAMMKDWMASSTDYADPDLTTSKQFTEQVSRSVTQAVLVGSREADFWSSPDKTGYSLMAVDLNDSFYKAFQDKAKKALQDHQDAVLKVKMEDALKDLDSYLDKERAK